MAIIEALEAYRDFAFRNLTEETLDLLQHVSSESKAYRSERLKRGLILFECFLDITGQEFRVDEALSFESFLQVTEEFIGALYSPVFLNATTVTRYEYARAFQEVFTKLAARVFPLKSFEPIRLRYHSASPETEHYKNSFEARELLEEKVKFWCGWTFINSAGDRVIIPLYSIFVRLGLEFANRLYDACKTFQINRRRSAPPCIPELGIFIANYPGEIHPQDFGSRQFVTQFLTKFGAFYFQSTNDLSPKSVDHMCRTWRSFGILMDECIVPQNVMAKYLGVFPNTSKPKLSGDDYNVRKTDWGYVKEKLITPVPLEVTDAVAMELLCSFARRIDPL